MRGCHDLGEIAPRCRLSARQMNLQDAKSSRLAKDTRPGLGIEFVLRRIERQRIGAIRAPERAAMRQFGEQAKRCRKLSFSAGGGCRCLGA
jgi:hypothetical protein